MSHLRHADRSRRGERPRSLEEIVARKRELVERCAEQRNTLTRHVGGLGPAFAAGDKVVGVGRSILSHPLLLAAAGGLLLALWPRAIFGMAARGFALWNGLAAVRRLTASRG